MNIRIYDSDVIQYKGFDNFFILKDHAGVVTIYVGVPNDSRNIAVDSGDFSIEVPRDVICYSV